MKNQKEEVLKQLNLEKLPKSRVELLLLVHTKILELEESSNTGIDIVKIKKDAEVQVAILIALPVLLSQITESVSTISEEDFKELEYWSTQAKEVLRLPILVGIVYQRSRKGEPSYLDDLVAKYSSPNKTI